MSNLDNLVAEILQTRHKKKANRMLTKGKKQKIQNCENLTDFEENETKKHNF